jgi:hypothetical protein
MVSDAFPTARPGPGLGASPMRRVRFRREGVVGVRVRMVRCPTRNGHSLLPSSPAGHAPNASFETTVRLTVGSVATERGPRRIHSREHYPARWQLLANRTTCYLHAGREFIWAIPVKEIAYGAAARDWRAP